MSIAIPTSLLAVMIVIAATLVFKYSKGMSRLLAIPILVLGVVVVYAAINVIKLDTLTEAETAYGGRPLSFEKMPPGNYSVEVLTDDYPTIDTRLALVRRMEQGADRLLFVALPLRLADPSKVFTVKKTGARNAQPGTSVPGF